MWVLKGRQFHQFVKEIKDSDFTKCDGVTG